MSLHPTAERIDGDTAVVAETGLGWLQVAARTASSALLIDEPVSAGGLGSGPNPYDLLAAALGACTSMTLRLYADRKGWPLTRVRVTVRHHRASLEARDLFQRTISLEGPLDDDQRARLLDIAERCPVHRTLDRGSNITTALVSPTSQDALAAVGPPQHLRDMEEVGV